VATQKVGLMMPPINAAERPTLPVDDNLSPHKRLLCNALSNADASAVFRKAESRGNCPKTASFRRGWCELPRNIRSNVDKYTATPVIPLRENANFLVPNSAFVILATRKNASAGTLGRVSARQGLAADWVRVPQLSGLLCTKPH